MTDRYEVDQLEIGYNDNPAERWYITTITQPWSNVPDKPLRIATATLGQAKALEHRRQIFKIQVWPYKRNRRMYREGRPPVDSVFDNTWG